MLISELATRVTQIPLNNLREVLESDYKVHAIPGSFPWASFKYGNELRQKIFAEKMEPFEDDYRKLGKINHRTPRSH